MTERKTKASRISNKAHAYLTQASKDTGISIVRLIDMALGLEDAPKSNKAYSSLSEQKAFKQSVIGQALETPWVKDAIAAHARNRIPKPPKSVIDSAILIVFINDPIYPPVQYRKDLLDAVKKYMTEVQVEDDINTSWSAVYPEFFDGYDNRHSRLERYFDNRIRALVNAGILLSSPTPENRARYILIKDLTARDWQVVRGINLIKANSGFRIKSGIHSLLFLGRGREEDIGKEGKNLGRGRGVGRKGAWEGTFRKGEG